MKRTIATLAIASAALTATPGTADATPSSCSTTWATSMNPDAASAWCMSGWQPGDRAQLRVTCRNGAGYTTTSGHIGNIVTGPGQIMRDYCPSTHPYLQSTTIRKWNYYTGQA